MAKPKPRTTKPIVLTRSPWATFRWYATSKVGKVVSLALIVLLTTGGLWTQWPTVTNIAKNGITGLAGQIEPTTGPSPQKTATSPAVNPTEIPVDVKKVLASQKDLTVQLTESNTALTNAAALTNEDRAPLQDLVTACTTVLEESTDITVMNQCTTDLKAATTTVNDKVAALPPTVVTPPPVIETPVEPVVPAPVNPAPVAPPAPVTPPVTRTATKSLSTNCASDATVNFDASGGGEVRITVTGPASKTVTGNGTASASVTGGAGTYTATATSPSWVNLNVSWTGKCS